ncbi:hypothetical protein FRX31_006884 [Thalictrum thalictroides]|uniref:Uncharacterized protein n=1 Tax=Thalictrum thalictroides TaxID=46969 RepID=A0A7J6X403_THATH|nr:hypothetical protein FRX31_006884 [Thalictrum thalictroides]
MEGEGVRDKRRWKSLRVEDKSFEFEVLNGGKDGFSVIEKGVKGTFKGRMDTQSCRWLGKLLCQISIGDFEPGLAFRTMEDLRSITGTVRKNRSGLYLQILIVARGRRNSFANLCFPSGENRKGWALLGTSIRSIFEVVAQPVANGALFPPRTTQCSKGNLSYVDTVVGKGDGESQQKQVVVNSRGGLFHVSWWCTTAIVSTECPNPDIILVVNSLANGEWGGFGVPRFGR